MPGKPHCGFVGALVRNLLLPADVVFGWIFMLVSKHRQRLGDRIAGTVVLKKIMPTTRPVHQEVIASWEERTKATILDLALLGMFAGTYLHSIGVFDIAVGGGYPVLRLRTPPFLLSAPVAIELLILIELLGFYFIVLEALCGGSVEG